MVSTELVQAVLVADIALYGFMILYYAFSLGLNEQEKTRVYLQLSSPIEKDATKEERDAAQLKADEQWMDILARAASGNFFLLGCTLFAVLTAILAVLALGGIEVLGMVAVGLFVFFLIVVASGMAGVGVQNLKQNAREFREKSGAPTQLMDVLMRGIGKK